MAKRPYSFTFTYSKRNTDVRDLIEDKKKYDKNFVTTDYMCEAVRFYEKNKDKITSTGLNEEDVKRIVNNLLSNNSSITTPLQNQELEDEKAITTNLDIDNLDSVKDKDLEDD